MTRCAHPGCGGTVVLTGIDRLGCREFSCLSCGRAPGPPRPWEAPRATEGVGLVRAQHRHRRDAPAELRSEHAP